MTEEMPVTEKMEPKPLEQGCSENKPVEQGHFGNGPTEQGHRGDMHAGQRHPGNMPMEHGHHGNKQAEHGKRHMDDNVIYVGKKGVMNYVMAAITQLNKGEKEIHVKARGRSISKAVDIVQLLKNRFETSVKVKGIDIGTEEVEAEEGGKIKVSTIDIILMK